MRIPIAKIAAEAECLDGIDMKVVRKYRLQLRNREIPPDVLVWGKNRQGYYLLADGYHRTMAAMLEGRTHVSGVICGKPVPLRWRWPRRLPFVTQAPRDLVVRKR